MAYTSSEAAQNMHEAYLKCKDAFNPIHTPVNDTVFFDSEEEEFFYQTVSDFFIARRQSEVIKNQSYGKRE